MSAYFTVFYGYTELIYHFFVNTLLALMQCGFSQCKNKNLFNHHNERQKSGKTMLFIKPSLINFFFTQFFLPSKVQHKS